MLDTGMVFHGSLLGYMFSLSIFGFGVVALNIAVAWIEVVEKSQKKGQAGNTKKCVRAKRARRRARKGRWRGGARAKKSWFLGWERSEREEEPGKGGGGGALPPPVARAKKGLVAWLGKKHHPPAENPSRATPGSSLARAAHARSVARGRPQLTRSLAPARLARRYKMGIYGSILTYFLLMFVCFIVLGSTTLAGVVVMLALIFKAVVFTFAGKKLGKMLEGGGPKAGEEDKKEMNMEMMVKGTSKRIAFVSAGTLVLVVLFLMTTNNNVWLSTVSLQGSMTIVCYINSTILCFIRFGGRRAMIKAGLKPIFKVEGAQQGKLDVKNTTTSTSSSVAPEP
jgi:hypothetical protein